MTRALARRREREGRTGQRRPTLERELLAVDHRIGRLVDAITAGGPIEELLERLRTERLRKAALLGERRAFTVTQLDGSDATVLARLTAHAADLRRLLGGHLARTRHLLEVLLVGPVIMTPITEDGRRGYRFSGRLRLGNLFLGDRLETRLVVVAPTGFEPVFQP